MKGCMTPKFSVKAAEEEFEAKGVQGTILRDRYKK